MIEVGHASAQVRVYEDPAGRFHFQAYTPGTKNARLSDMICGRPADHLNEAAWFTVGDRRGRVHYERACTACRSRLVN